MLDNKFTQHQSVVDKYVNPITDYQMTTRDYVTRVVASAATVITLPPVAEASGRLYSILARTATSANTVTIQDKGDSESWTDIVLVTDDNYAVMYSDGMKWYALASLTA